jgi:hypothetical protein
MSKGKRHYGWLPDSDNPDNEHIRALLLKLKAKRTADKIRTIKKRVKK